MIDFLVFWLNPTRKSLSKSATTVWLSQSQITSILSDSMDQAIGKKSNYSQRVWFTFAVMLVLTKHALKIA